MSTSASDPAWLSVMRSLIGAEWSPSDGPSQTINGWLRFISGTYPATASYCASVSNGSYFSWCGMAVGYCMAKAGIMPVFGATDTTRFLWAMAWLGWGTPVSVPQRGDVLVFDFGGGDHHVTLFDSDNGDGTWACLGGNQSHAVKLSNFSKSSLMGIRRAPAIGVQPVAAVPAARFTGIVATVFGGAADRNTSAYDGHVITDTELGCALPYRFSGVRPQVRVSKGSQSVVCDIVDVGPWNINDPYWQTGSRPQAESGIDKTGRQTNHAGIDLTPAAAAILGVDGKGTVDWDFVTAQKDSPVTTPQIDINALLAQLQPQINALIVQAVQQAVAAIPPAPALPAVIMAPQTLPQAAAAPAITVASTIAHIQPVMDIINKSLAGILPPPYDLIPKALGAVGHLIAASGGNVQATPASIGQAINDLTQAGIGGLHAGGVNLPSWLQDIATALQPPTPPAPAAAKSAAAP